MRAETWAILTAICWAVGSFFEKKGIKLGGYSPVMGAAIRTAVSMVVLALLSFPYWGQLKSAGVKPTLMIAISGGVFSGALGIMFLYFALSSGNISIVLPIAFCLTPVLGSILGVAFLNEKLHMMQAAGIFLMVIGATLTVYFKAH